jgi:hypothetical protein
VRRRGGISRLALLAVAIGLIATTPLPVAAHSVDTRLSLDVGDHTVRPNQEITFFGRLRTEAHKARCQRNARIQLIRVGTGVIATDVTDAQGEFSFTIDPQPDRGRYFVRYAGSAPFGYRSGHRCEGDDSRKISIRPTNDDRDDRNDDGEGKGDDGKGDDGGGRDSRGSRT